MWCKWKVEECLTCQDGAVQVVCLHMSTRNRMAHSHCDVTQLFVQQSGQIESQCTGHAFGIVTDECGKCHNLEQRSLW